MHFLQNLKTKDKENFLLRSFLMEGSASSSGLLLLKNLQICMLPLKSIKLTTTNKGNTIKLRNKAKKPLTTASSYLISFVIIAFNFDIILISQIYQI